MKNITTIKQLAVKHDYYCSESNYFDSSRSDNYKTFKQFSDQWLNADIDMNLCFRWDVKQYEDEDVKGNLTYSMEVFIMQQRKGIFYPIYIENVTDEDVPSILEYLKPHQEKLLSLWKPL